MSRKVRKVDPENLEIRDSKIMAFINAQKPKTAKTYRSFFRTIIRLTQCKGEDMLANPKLWNKKLKEIKNKMVEEQYSLGTIHAHLGAVMGFFTYYDVDLHLNKQQRKDINEKARNSEDYLFSNSDLKRMWSIANLKEKYVLCNTSYGLRSEDYVLITYGMYRAAIERMDREHLDAPVFVTVLDTGKEHIPATLFMNSDVIPVIRAILDSHRDATDLQRIWTEREVQLSEILKALMAKCGIDPHGARIRFHNIRKFTYSALSKNINEEFAKMIVGKKTKESAYLDPNALREVYQKAMGDLLIVRNGTSPETTNKLIDLEKENRELREKLKRAEDIATTRDTENKGRIDELYAMIKEMKEGKKD